MILRVYLLSLLPVRAVLVQTVQADTLLGGLNAPHILNVALLAINVGFLIAHGGQIASTPSIRTVFWRSIALAFVLVLQPIYAYAFTGSLIEFAQAMKLLSWLPLIPLSALALHDWESIAALKKSALVSFAIVVICLIAANVYEIGKTAYNLDIFYIGWFRREAPLAISLAMYVPLLLLPAKDARRSPWGAGTFFLLTLVFVLLLLTMKRGSIIVVPIGTTIAMYLVARHRMTDFTTAKFVTGLGCRNQSPLA